MKTLENRIPPPLITLIVAIAMWGATFVTPPLAFGVTFRYSLVAAFFLLGGLFGFPAFIAFGRAKTTTDPVHIDRASAIVTSGVYRFTRNPMYVGLTCLLLSWSAYLSSPWTLLGPLFFVLYITRFQIVPEERSMEARFGAPYLAYKSRVRRWL
jgi:protein-S-isoprenylcysteine O-methyltransferase Ste14